MLKTPHVCLVPQEHSSFKLWLKFVRSYVLKEMNCTLKSLQNLSWNTSACLPWLWYWTPNFPQYQTLLNFLLHIGNDRSGCSLSEELPKQVYNLRYNRYCLLTNQNADSWVWRSPRSFCISFQLLVWCKSMNYM